MKNIEVLPKKNQFLESCFFEKKAQFLESCVWSQIAKKFNSLSHISLQKCAILWVIFKKSGFNSLRYFIWKNSESRSKRVQFFDSFSKVNSLKSIKKGSTLQVILKNFNSLSHIEKVLLRKVQFFESYFEKGSILWEIFWGRVQFCESYEKKCSILWVVLKKVFNSVSRIEKRMNSVSRIEKKDEFCGSASKRKFNSVSYFYWWKNFESWKKKGPFLWIKKIQKFKYPSHEKRFNSLSHIKKGPSIGVMKKGRNNAFSQIEQKKSLVLWVIFSTKSSILWVISKKGSILLILWVFF